MLPIRCIQPPWRNMLVIRLANAGSAATSGGKAGLSKHRCRNGPVALDEQSSRLLGERDLVQKDQHAGRDDGDGQDRGVLSRVVVVERDHGSRLRRPWPPGCSPPPLPAGVGLFIEPSP